MTVISLRREFLQPKEILDPNVVPSPATGDAPCHVIDGDLDGPVCGIRLLFLSN
ncbi:Hypothetical protein FKW44_024831 [Caligus rogercresseyi]|uniref:Uncharacterized protein n=1 Tax=Caligus rogercresseyi TaxID=217165 RepID=A0A7T8JTK3_CALRO|nr:Hypothetical protein FKW44_024831 [Caligus rogercresseyi]